jgi:hypothetical protein
MAVGLVAFALLLGAAQAAPAEAVDGMPRDRKPATILLNSLPVSPERGSGYRREAFADWRDADGDGCDTREEVLVVERVGGTIVGCSVRGGQWASAYDSVVTRDPGSFDIDHRVPLAEAWASGAWRWTQSTRARYANDLGYAASLIAVSASSNRSKGDDEPDEWMPSAPGQRCTYVKLWIGVKYRWRLSVDAAEKSFLHRQLRTCDVNMSLPGRALVHTR